MNLVRFFLTKIPAETVYAHCDIPCGIYDPHQMQLAAHTVIRMTQFLGEIKRDDETRAEHDVARVTHVKEEHSEILEHEVNELRNEYFKPEHHEKFPNLNKLIEDTLKAAGKARKGIDIKSAQEALSGTQEIAEIFYQTKGVTPIRVKTVYPTEREIVLYK
jgi:nickel superoxide dismutase